jgi:hypothetical protein
LKEVAATDSAFAAVRASPVPVGVDPPSTSSLLPPQDASISAAIDVIKVKLLIAQLLSVWGFGAS